MADKQMYPVNLYDENGGYVGQVEHDEDVNAARDRPLSVGGKTYVYQARSDRWTEVGEPHEVKGKPKQAAEEPAKEEPKGGEKPVVHSGMLDKDKP